MADENGGNAALGGCIVVVDTRDKSGNDYRKCVSRYALGDEVQCAAANKGKKASTTKPKA